MNASEVVARARSQLGMKTQYELGRGGFHPNSLTAADAAGRCDCSGFVAWCLNASRHIDNPLYKQWLGNWVETSAIVRDARSGETGMFALVETKDAEPGMVYVWGDPKSGRGQGHCGIITEVGPEGPTKVIHCSKSGWVKHQDAIRETGPEIFITNNAIVARCGHVDHETAAA